MIIKSSIENFYWEDDDLENVDQCPVCHSVSIAPLYRGVPDFLESIPGKWDMARCLRCQSVFLCRRPKKSAIHKAYKTYYTHQSGVTDSSSNKKTGLIWAIVNDYLHLRYGCKRTPRLRFGAHLIRLLPPLRQQLDYYLRMLPKSDGRILDVGCGNGEYLLRASECNWEIFGVEPDEQAAKVASKITNDIFVGRFEQFQSRLRFDAITASHVIEHVYDPAEFASHALSLLKPGGMLWISTPNADSIGHMWFKSAWRGLEAPRHISIFSPSALVQMLRRVGFEKVQLNRRGRGSQYIIRESERNLRELGNSDKCGISPWFVDLAASAWPTLGEELVVTGVRPL